MTSRAEPATIGASGERPGATPLTWATLTVAVLAVSGSGPLMASIAVPALAIAFWRNGIAAAVLAPIATIRVLRGAQRPSRKTLAGCVLAGLLLSAHFACWVPSLTMTSVATATALVCAQPVWAALIDRASGRRHSRRFLVGVMGALF
jgi:drug/metabolite transporter (DMT)-like permease